jgi:hypothetical protein
MPAGCKPLILCVPCNLKLKGIMELINQLLARASLPEVLSTSEAAAALKRQPQTLRKWACLENGPIRPIRINGRLGWRVSDLKALLEGDK